MNESKHETVSHPKIQTETKENILFLRNELKTAALKALADLSPTVQSISEARQAAQARSKSGKIKPNIDIPGVTQEIEYRIDKVRVLICLIIIRYSGFLWYLI